MTRTFVTLTLLGLATTAAAQSSGGAPLPPVTRPPVESNAPQPQPQAQITRVYDSAELDRIVSPIALYPDPLLAQVLTACMYPRDIPEAAQWADNHSQLTGEQIADELAADQVPWNPSVQALVPFPTVLGMMASAMPWTRELGEAFNAQRADVMDAVQRMRSQAQHYGYLQSNDNVRVTNAPYIEIAPVNPDYWVVPYYDPMIVFYSPRTRFLLSSAINFGYGVHLGIWYEPWGYGYSGFRWNTHYAVYDYPGWNRPRSWYRTDYYRDYSRSHVVVVNNYGNRGRDYGRNNGPRDINRGGGNGYQNVNLPPNGHGIATPDGYRNRTAQSRDGQQNSQQNVQRDVPRDAQRGGQRQQQAPVIFRGAGERVAVPNDVPRGGRQEQPVQRNEQRNDVRNDQRRAPQYEQRSAPQYEQRSAPRYEQREQRSAPPPVMRSEQRGGGGAPPAQRDGGQPRGGNGGGQNGGGNRGAHQKGNDGGNGGGHRR